MLREQFEWGKEKFSYHSLPLFAQSKGFSLDKLPISIKILMENLLRHGGTEEELRALALWNDSRGRDSRAIPFHPRRVVMQDFTGVPAVVDLAGMRDALAEAGEDPEKINPLISVDLVVDHSISVDYSATPEAYSRNVAKEYERNSERYRLLSWAQKSFKNFRVVPPGKGIVHQVNLEYLSEVISREERGGETLVFPDTLVGTDSHTTMIGGLAVLGWGVGGIEAEAAMLGQPVTILIPEVVGVRFTGSLPRGTTATDLVLRVTEMLRAQGVVGQFVEFYGPGLDSLTLADRATISNMAPEYGATCGFFPIDSELVSYLRLSGRGEAQAALVEEYARRQGLWRDKEREPEFTRTLELELPQVGPSIAGPGKPQSRVPLGEAAPSFERALKEDYRKDGPGRAVPVRGKDYSLKHGDVVIAAITSCTNTSNPAVLISAGLLAKKAVQRGLKAKPWVKTSFAPGSRVVTSYLDRAGLTPYLEELGFHLVGYGCTTCIGNSGALPPPIEAAIEEGNLITCNVLSGNRNFPGRIHPASQASYLASPPLVVAYALAGTLLRDITTEPLGEERGGKEVFLKELWPSPEEIDRVARAHLTEDLFVEGYRSIFEGTPQWRKLAPPAESLYAWDMGSTYIRRPPFFEGFAGQIPQEDILGARCLAILPDGTTTDHISPAGAIPSDGPAGTYLKEQGVSPAEFNSFGSRRGNHEVMLRGTFGNIRLKNQMVPHLEGGKTLSPQGDAVTIFEAAQLYREQGLPLLVFAGREYGTGSSRDWASKGTFLLGIRAVIAQSFERIHRSNLVGMGVLPLEFPPGENTETLGISGAESYDLQGLKELRPGGEVVLIIRKKGEPRRVILKTRIDTAQELEYYLSGGILRYVLRKYH